MSIGSGSSDKKFTHFGTCIGCLHELEDNLGGPDPDNGICMGCVDGDMYNNGSYGRFVAG